MQDKYPNPGMCEGGPDVASIQWQQGSAQVAETYISVTCSSRPEKSTQRKVAAEVCEPFRNPGKLLTLAI